MAEISHAVVWQFLSQNDKNRPKCDDIVYAQTSSKRNKHKGGTQLRSPNITDPPGYLENKNTFHSLNDT